MIEDIDNEDLANLTKIAGLDSLASYRDRLPRGYLSVSQVTQFMKCGKAYEFRYVYEKPVPKNSYMAQGSAVHKVAEKLNEYIMYSGTSPSVEFVEDHYDAAHEEQFKTDVVIAEEDGDVGKIKDVGIDLVRVYHAAATGTYIDTETKERIPGVYPIGVEKVVKKELDPKDGSEPVPFLGVIDLVENGKVIDFKTKRKKGGMGEVENSLQLSIYAEFEDVPHVRIDQLVKPTKTMKSRYFRMEATRSLEERAHAIDIVASVARDIAAGRFPLTMPDNWWCTVNWCPYWDDCRGRKR